jgi:hypothetical protein
MDPLRVMQEAEARMNALFGDHHGLLGDSSSSFFHEGGINGRHHYENDPSANFFRDIEREFFGNGGMRGDFTRDPFFNRHGPGDSFG